MPAIIKARAACTCSSTSPAAAQAVGYNLLTYGSHVTLGQNWFPWTGNVATQNLTQNADGSVTDNGGAGNHYNAHVTSTNINGSNFTQGVCFAGGGYFECTFKFTGLPAGFGTPQTADGWPSWWCSDPGITTFQQHTEIDWMEWFCNAADPSVNLPPNSIGGTAAAFNSGIIDWYSSSLPLTNGCSCIGSGNYGYNDTCFVPSNNDPSQYHKVAGLWVPATATTQGYSKTYFDNNQVGPTHTWSLYDGGIGPTGVPGGTSSPFSALDSSHIQLLWGTGTNNPMTVSAINVWQKDDSQNIRRGVALGS